MKDLPKVKKTAVDAAREAGDELLKRYHKFRRENVSLKSFHEIVTKADIASEKIIIDKIRKNLPDHSILSEESGSNEKVSNWLWVVDPLDGTTNFSMHNPLWAVSIGVAYKGKMVFGVVHAPFLGETFTAEKGRGAKLNNKKITVSKDVVGKTLNTFCHSTHPKDIKRAIRYYKIQKENEFDCRQLGSASIELAYTAAGRLESIVIPGAHPWDVAAGVLLVREAGGRVTDFKNKKWTLESPDMMATNGQVHKQILQVIK